MNKNSSVFTPQGIKEEAERLRKIYREEQKKKKEANKGKRKEELKQLLKDNLLPYHQFVHSLDEYKEPTNDDFNENFESLKKYINLEKLSFNACLMCKIYIGKYVNKLLSICDNDKSVFLFALKQNNIVYTKTELFFAKKLASIAEEFPVFLVSIFL